MRSKLRASRALAAAALTAGLAGGGVLGVTAVAGAQTGGDRPPAEADRPPGGHGPGLDALLCARFDAARPSTITTANGR